MTQSVTLKRGLSEPAVGLDLFAQVGVVTRPAKKVQQPAEDGLMTPTPSGRPQYALNDADHPIELSALS